MPQLHYERYWWFIGGLLVGTVIALSLVDSGGIPSVGGNDKTDHLVAYGVLMGYFANLRYGLTHRVLCAIGFSLLGVLLEFVQAFVGREFDLGDMRANCLGVAIAWALVYTPLGRVVAWLDIFLQRRVQ